MIKHYDLIRQNDKYLIVIELELINHNKYCTVSFLDNQDIIETSKGFIRDNCVYLHKIGHTSVRIIKQVDTSPICCILNFFDDKKLLYSENYNIDLGNIDTIKHNGAFIMKIPTITNMYQDKADYLNNNLSKIKSSWKCSISIEDDIKLIISSVGSQKIQVSIGEESSHLSPSDYVFSLLPENSKINIPKEIIWNKYDLYKNNTLRIFELMRPDFIANNNILYKIPISNSIDISNVPKKVSVSTVHKDMLSNQFNSNWHIGKLGLPVQKAEL